MKPINKAISLSLVTALSLETLNAGIMDNALQNYTPASQYTAKDSNGNTIKTMYYSGGYYFRFNKGSSAQPIWAFSPPEIEAGCNGFNLKGMFMSLLGLDQFGSMLQNAGTSLAWGVAVGLIYSLPGVASVFKMINQWAKDIQKLLSMGCQAGIAIGEAMASKIGDKTGYTKEEFDKALRFGMDGNEVANFMQGGEKGRNDVMGLTGLNFNWDSGFSFAGNTKATDSKIKDAISTPLSNLFGDYSLGGSILNDYLRLAGSSALKNDILSMVTTETNPLFYKRMYLTYDGTQGISGTVLKTSSTVLSNALPSIEDKSYYGLKFLSYAIFYNLVGDIGYNEDTIKTTVSNIASNYKCSNANSTPVCATGENSNDSDKKLFESLNNPALSTGTTAIVGNVGAYSRDQLLNLLLKGYDSAGTNNGSKNKPFLAPGYIVMGAKEKNSANNNYFVTASDPSDNITFFTNTDKFMGTIVLARCSVYQTLNGVVKSPILEELQKDSSGNPVTCSSYPNVMFSDLKIYADTLSKATEEEISDGISLITDYTSYLLASAILKNLESMTYSKQLKGIKQIANAGATTSEPSKSQQGLNGDNVTLLAKKISDFQEAITTSKAELDKEFPSAKNGVMGDQSLNSYFYTLKRKIQERQAPKQ